MNVFEALHTGLPSIVTSVIPNGTPYTITGAANGSSWTVAEGVGIGATVSVSDPACPFGKVDYTVTAGAVVESTFLVRELTTQMGVDTLFTSENGRLSVAATWEGDAAMSWSPGSTFAQPLARRFPVQTRPLAAGGPSWAVEFRVDLDEVEQARRILESGLVWMAHSASHSDGGSTLPPVMLAGIDGAVSEGRWPLGRTYSFTVRQLEIGVTGVPVVTFGEADTVWSGTIPTTFTSIRTTTGGE